MSEIALSVVLPCYNEERAVPGIFAAFQAIQKDYPWELVLVDNGSTDGTSAAIAGGLARPENAFARTVRVEVNQGYGYGILSGLAAARGAALAWSHADLQTPPADIFRAYETLRASGRPERTMVKGRRQRRAPGQEIVTLVMQALASTVLLKPLTDINAQPKAFPRALYELFRDPPHDFNLDLYLYHLALQRGYDVKTIPVVFGERPFGVSKWAMNLRSRWKHIKATIRYIFRLRMRS